MSPNKELCRRVKRWREEDHRERWAVSTLLLAESKFRRVKGYKEIPQLLSALANHRMKKGLPPQPKLRKVMRTKSHNSQRRFVHSMSLNPYLYFDGQCEEAFKFYEKRLGGKITFMMTWEGASMAGQAPPCGAKKILHAGLAFGDGVLEGYDAMPGEYTKPQSFCVMLRSKDAKEAERIFRALAEGGTVQIPIAETFWAQRFGKLVDRFGMPWLINCEKPAA